MGLDSYLYAQKYESLHTYQLGEDFEKKATKFYPKNLREFALTNGKNNFLSKETKYQIGYWRKANAIHKWFVDNCGEGIDECQEIYVGKDDVKNLLNHCNAVLKDHSLAKELLPTQSGFFFGSTEFDDWYFDDLEYTRDLLQSILDNQLFEKRYEIIYRASW